MNPESLLHDAAELLQAEAKKGPGTMFIVRIGFNNIVTRTPNPADKKMIIARYDCQKFLGGISAMMWAALLKKLWAAYQEQKKGAAGGQQPAQKPQSDNP